jgi:glycogen synthase
MVTRLAEQKGVDLALDAARFLADIPARLVLLGAGDKALAEQARTRPIWHPIASRSSRATTTPSVIASSPGPTSS